MKRIISIILVLMSLFGSGVLAKESSDWAAEEINSAGKQGIIPMMLVTANLTDNITRGECAALAVNLFDMLKPNAKIEINCPFTDCSDDYIKKAYSLGIVSGKSDSEFYPYDLVTRQEIAKMLMNTLKAAEKITVSKSDTKEIKKYSDYNDIAEWAREDIASAVRCGLISGLTKTELAPKGNASREQAIVIVSRSLKKYGKTAYSKTPEISSFDDGAKLCGNVALKWNSVSDCGEYIAVVKDNNANIIDACVSNTTTSNIVVENLEYSKEYTVTVGAIKNNGKIILSKTKKFTYIAEKEIPKDSFLTLKEKYRRVFPTGEPFTTKEEADLYMATVEVPAWKLKEDGSKVKTKYTLCVNKELCEDVVNIFTEIFEDAEQFPIKNVGGYSFRNSAVGRVSEHSYGTCIDINYDENYYCYADTGEAITGSFWKPYENPYSIPEDGSVVRIFAKYGWSWGGNAWTKLHDYMHFTYLGN